ncbi:MAG: hypothetical protein H0V34_08940, partial [Gammaproteobacteria bacterium]|nr:hypothetical protein [Gammaproteobacteria bacterium]
NTLKALPRRQRRLIQRQWKHSLAAVALLFALGAQPALAATINVGGTCTLIRAIVAANNDTTATGHCAKGSGADTIVLPRNSTQSLTAINNNTYDFGATGLPVIRSVITIAGNGSTIRRASSAPAFRVFAVDQDRTSSSTCADCGNLTLRDTALSGGKAAPSAGSPHSRFGGAVLNLGGVVTLINSVVSGNAAETGGGLMNDEGIRYEGAFLRLIDSTVSGNRASKRGGGIGNFEYSSVRMNNSTVSGNSAGTDGGGIFNGYASGVTVNNSTISGNSARDGGGVYTYGRGIVSLIHSTIHGNSASVMGGGIHNAYQGGVTLAHVLLSGNRAPAGAELHEELDDRFGTVTAADFNLFGHSGLTNSQAFSGFTPGVTDITATSDGDTPTALGAILNRSLASNGGRTRTHALVAGSPAVDAVNDGTCPPPARDQRGVRRPQDGNGDGGPACDIGSFERR